LRKGLSDDERIAVLGDFVRTTYTAEAGFTEEDGMEFAEWLSDRMGIAP
jgi:hypothetical protein